MKLVVNRCFGGFSLSNEAVELFYKKKFNKKVYHFKTVYENGNYESRKYEPSDGEGRGLFDTSFTVPNPNDFDKEVLWKEYYVSNRPEGRDDKFLIETIEELGYKKSNGACASLEIVEIPDGIDWEITEYDGNESIEEVHRRW